MIEEIKLVRKNYGTNLIYFRDDTFDANKEWLLSLLERYKKEIDLPFRCNVHVSNVDEQVVKVLKESGCYIVCFGVETGNEELRKKVLHKRIVMV